jgi:cysteinyl-tRNA synthetase
LRYGLKLFNTMTLRKERFEPLRPGKVKMFVCGPTVQGPMHLGHARTYVFYDVLARYLTHLGYSVKFLMNITDIDEKITEAARRNGKEPFELARVCETAFLSDMSRLSIRSITRFERVSDYIQRMIDQAERLIESGHAYVADGAVYFDTSTFPNYGKLSHLSKRELLLRPLELSPHKRNLIDFTLWRPIQLVGDRWKSPWGTGSPGWHIQDTAVTLSVLGSQYDIHGGAYELIYPHHEAEIAQAESLTGVHPFVKYWVHTKLVVMEGEKMSKSKGNVITVNDMLGRLTASELRLFLLMHHYREDMNLTGIQTARSLFRQLARAVSSVHPNDLEGCQFELDGELEQFYERVSDDIDTPGAIGALQRLARSNGQNTKALRALAWAARNILGVDLSAR